MPRQGGMHSSQGRRTGKQKLWRRRQGLQPQQRWEQQGHDGVCAWGDFALILYGLGVTSEVMSWWGQHREVAFRSVCATCCDELGLATYNEFPWFGFEKLIACAILRLKRHMCGLQAVSLESCRECLVGRCIDIVPLERCRVSLSQGAITQCAYAQTH